MALRFSAKRGSLSTRVDRRLIPRKENPVQVNILNEVAALQRLSVGQLRQRFAELFGETTQASNRTWLVKRIAWRMQAPAEGDLSQRARRRAAELARDADLRLNPPQHQTIVTIATPEPIRTPAPADPRLPPPGTILTRPYTCHYFLRGGGAGRRSRRTVPSAPVNTAERPSGEKAREKTPSFGPERRHTSLVVAMS
jgi:hypothetical protein